MRTLFVILFLALLPNRGGCALHYADFHDRVIPSDSDGIYINPVSGTFSSTTPADFESGPWINLLFGGTAIGNSSYITLAITDPATGNGDGLVLKLPGSQEIGSALNFTVGANGSENHTGSEPTQFQSGEPGYIGFAITSGGQSNYGWLCITVNGTGTGIVRDAAWEDTLELAVQAGSVPEPDVPAMILLAAAAFILGRRR